MSDNGSYHCPACMGKVMVILGSLINGIEKQYLNKCPSCNGLWKDTEIIWVDKDGRSM